ncbi:MAG: 5'/3'-nucleotidase SurE [Bacteroidales bacterium]|nr:5'/3'-nucleotidase SurE [Bacteroidales bacterium]
MKPLILITNDDGYAARGLKVLTEVAREFGDVVVMAPEQNASAKGLSLTTKVPVRVREVQQEKGLHVYACDGTPVDCLKLAYEHFCPRRPNLVLSGINHGSNSSINVLYSGTMGAVIEATVLGVNAIGFSLLNHSLEADFEPSRPIVRHIVGHVLKHGLPADVALNVNIPRLTADEIKGIRLCHQASGKWLDSFEKRVDPIGRPYWWLTGKFVCNEPPDTSDEWALMHGYVSVVPIHTDYTHYPAIGELKNMEL